MSQTKHPKHRLKLTIHVITILYSYPCLAQANEDFKPVDLDLIFNGETSNTQNVSITILNDICLEEDGEDFTVVVTSGMDCVEIISGSVSIAIHDDDSEFLLS